MNKKLKEALQEGFEAPVAQKKKEFLRSIQTPPIHYFEFICLQAGYIHKWIWGFSTLIFAVALTGAQYLEKDMLLCISALMPLLALSVITESGRSVIYGMAEFELSTRFSLKSVVLARLGILGGSNLILVSLLVPFACMNSKTTILQTSVYMLCPYLLTAFLGLWAVRRVRGKEAFYICTGIALCISVGNIMLYRSLPALFGEHCFTGWISALVLLGIGTAKECRQTIKQTEELAWNL